MSAKGKRRLNGSSNRFILGEWLMSGNWQWAKSGGKLINKPPIWRHGQLNIDTLAQCSVYNRFTIETGVNSDRYLRPCQSTRAQVRSHVTKGDIHPDLLSRVFPHKLDNNATKYCRSGRLVSLWRKTQISCDAKPHFRIIRRFCAGATCAVSHTWTVKKLQI